MKLNSGPVNPAQGQVAEARMGDVPSRRPSSSPVHGCLAPAVQLVREQDLAPPSTHDLRLTRPQASSPRDMMDLSTLESGSELTVSRYPELCRPSPLRGLRDPGPFVAGGAGCVSSEVIGQIAVCIPASTFSGMSLQSLSQPLWP